MSERERHPLERAYAQAVLAEDQTHPLLGLTRHRVVIEFDDGVSAKLICPESGCTPGTTCGACGRDFTDHESTPCYDCKEAKLDECWIKTWFDNVGADELLHGKVEVEIDAEWDHDHMKARIV